jgi:hypothetical protein
MKVLTAGSFFEYQVHLASALSELIEVMLSFPTPKMPTMHIETMDMSEGGTKEVLDSCQPMHTCPLNLQ